MKENLLPHHWKKIALGICIAAIVIWIIKTANPQLINIDSFTFSWVLKMLFLVSLLIYVFAKEKVETARNAQLRSSSLFAAITTGGLILIFEILMEVFFQGRNAEIISGYELMMILLVVYYISFYVKKNIKTVVRG